MSAKIIVHKFEEESNYKTLQITIGGNDQDLSDIKFSNWQDGKTEMKKKEKGKPRLVVKMVSDSNFSHMNIDSCFKVVDYADKYLSNILNKNSHIREDIKANYHTRNANLDESNSELDMYRKHHEALNEQPNDMRQNDHTMSQLNMNTFHFDNHMFDGIDPLECCLEKVNKNNALIMENIHMLNRTLNYTKKKEILDTINPKPLHPCNACGKCFVYETGLRRHFSVRHASLDTQPLWQLVWTCTECFQVWPRQDLAHEHANQCSNSNNIDLVQEIKTSSLLQCEFCEKVFTCIPRLLRHAKMHSVTNNFECNACNIVFSCYKTTEQHWLSCMWLKTCYQFSLPKLLLCNACDRKFRNYDQLYNHRYKLGHFMPKISVENNCAYPTLVYQCEICGQWFSTIAQLRVHRSQYHPQFDNGTSYNVDTSSATE
ncbi:zinc finger protein 480-like isoform X1 [Maniola jurtina]|uniref:zinc finger protein 480-like isoform X1 n=1 Tax=Maniola jurtina TaxID=191418 RepID=UPI001E687375|nr:zinc finger protein 480-like isoform X1 [Maniola jurtina]